MSQKGIGAERVIMGSSLKEMKGKDEPRSFRVEDPSTRPPKSKSCRWKWNGTGG